MDITIYSTPTCPHCIEAKRYFVENKIPFENIDVSVDHDKAQEMIELSGQMGVPVIKIEDKTKSDKPKIIVGFDEDEIAKALKL